MRKRKLLTMLLLGAMTLPAGAIGDVNRDDVVDIDDVNLLVNVMLGRDLEWWYEDHIYGPDADVDMSGVVDIDDLNTVINVILGLYKPDVPDAPGDAVDLGLPSGVLWANKNLGAVRYGYDDDGETYGYRFAWGELEPKGDWYPGSSNGGYTEENYAYADSPIALDNISGTEYDAARALWGGDWRMPTADDFKELIEMCTWVRTVRTIDEMWGPVWYGYTVYGPNGNSIAIPTYYMWYDATITPDDAYDTYEIDYWTATRPTSGSGDRALYTNIDFYASSKNRKTSPADTYCGMFIRPVKGEPNGVAPAVVTTGDAATSNTSATLQGHVEFDGGADPGYYEVVFYVSKSGEETDPSPWSHTFEVSAPKPGTDFSLTVTGLEPVTKYNYCAYVRLGGKNYKGQTRSFITTLNPAGSDGGEWVDLGLTSGTKWATWDLGTDHVGGKGDLFAWGEIETKDEFTRDNYAYSGTDEHDIDFYDDISGTEYDAATAHWGSEWRMPTLQDWFELVYECDTEVIHRGYPGWEAADFETAILCKGPNGNHIVFPLWNDLFYFSDDDTINYYWTSTRSFMTGGLPPPSCVWLSADPDNEPYWPYWSQSKHIGVDGQDAYAELGFRIRPVSGGNPNPYASMKHKQKAIAK